MLRAFVLAAGLALVATAATPGPAPARGVSVSDAWSRPAAARTNGAGFFTITNSGTRPDSLVSVSSTAADRVEMHQTSMTGGVMSMQRLDSGVMLPPGQSVTFGPGGKHLMLLGLKSALRKDGALPLTFHLASGRQLDIRASVRLSPPEPSRSK